MATITYLIKCIYLIHLFSLVPQTYTNDILGCGGFVKSHNNLDFTKIEIALYTKDGNLKEKTECAPTNGYYFLPLYEKGEYVLEVHPPTGWSFEPSRVNLVVDGVTDQCSTGQDINFVFNGFGITGLVVTAGREQGPVGVNVRLINDKGNIVSTVTTTYRGEFCFTPVIPGKYTIEAYHHEWRLEPSKATVQVREGNTVLPVGTLVVKGYDVRGSVTFVNNNKPISNLYVLLYSKEENPKYRVEGCETALLQGVPDGPICYSITDDKGEFNFGLVPAGEYKLLALTKTPGTNTGFNLVSNSKTFSVEHGSLYIKNAFIVTGFSAVGRVVSAQEAGVSGVQVAVGGEPVGKTDATGEYALPSLKPGTYTISFKHELCEMDDVVVTASESGAVRVPAARVARWRLCGRVTRPATATTATATTATTTTPRTVTIVPQRANAETVKLTPDDNGKWCTYLSPGTYTATVENTEEEQREGLQFYPLSHKINIAHAPVDGIVFSQLRARVSGRVLCDEPAACQPLLVTLRTLTPDGDHTGTTLTTLLNKGEYVFEEVLPGTVEVSVPTGRLCWRHAAHVVPVTQAHATVPDFQHTGYVVRFHASHHLDVEYVCGEERGTVSVPAGPSQRCVRRRGRYTFTPRSCHQLQPPAAQADVGADKLNTIHFIAVAHAAVVRVTSPEPASDVRLRISMDGRGVQDVGPLVAQRAHDGYVYEHTLYMADGEVAVVSARSSRLLFSPAAPQQLVARSECQRDALTLRAAPGLLLAGSLVPPVAGATLTLTSADEELKLTQVTGPEGTYSFGPLEASGRYSITAEKESYAFGAPDARGNIAAHKLAEILVQLLDEDGAPLQGALVSVSGGEYRRTAATGMAGAGAGGAGGAGAGAGEAGAGQRLRFPSLAPQRYFCKPLMKEYRFVPPHAIIDVEEGNTHELTFRGVRVAWSVRGRLVAVGGAGWARAGVVAAVASQRDPPPPPHPHSHATCASEEATTDDDGAFRIRGLLPDCQYVINLKEPSVSPSQKLHLVKHPGKFQLQEKKDMEDVLLVAVRQPHLTDLAVRVYTPKVDHYKTLRVVLTAKNTPDTPIYTVKVDATGFSDAVNPGLLYILPRLPLDSKAYYLRVESTLDKNMYEYMEQEMYFNSEGGYQSYEFVFDAEMRSRSQEPGRTSLLVVPLLLALLTCCVHRQRAAAALSRLAARLPARAAHAPHAAHAAHAPHADALDRASIDHIVSAVNAAGKRAGKRKPQ